MCEAALHEQHPPTVRISLTQPFIYLNPATTPDLVQGFSPALPIVPDLDER